MPNVPNILNAADHPPCLPFEGSALSLLYAPNCLPLDGFALSLPYASKSLPLEGSAVLNDTPVACQIRGPTDPQGDRWRAAPDEVS